MVVEDDKRYKRITIKTNCGGVFVRDEVLGKDIKTKKQYYVKAGQLAVSKIDARNGAFGIVPPEADGASRSEVKITTGAVVDAVWEAKIGNMGKAIYVFEVQSKGSIDSLILNLKKAQSNAAVQAVVAVADEEQLAKIIRESAGVIDEKSLRTWDSEDVLAVYDSLVRAHESINKLALVQKVFKKEK